MSQSDDASASLDPADWPAYRRLAHKMLDAALDHVEGVADRPVWQPVPERVKQALARPLPVEAESTEAVCRDIRDLLLPYGNGNIHPRFFGWVHGSGTPGGIVAELMAAAMNANLGGREHAPVYVERQVIDWCRQLMGFPETASGLLVSGTSIATLVALTVARNHKAGHDVNLEGLSADDRRLIAYTSAEAHGCVAKAMQLLGLGAAALRAIPVDRDYRMDLEILAERIAQDRHAGFTPFCVIGTAGTVNSGAIDDLAAVAGICAREGLWFHVDGAFGALAVMSEALRPRLAGIERADSLAFDFHKWMHVPYDAGCVLVRDAALHRAAFSGRREYLAAGERGLAGGNPWFCEYGPELSRGFRALKIWFTLREQGVARLGAAIERNCRQARHLAARIEETPHLALLAPVSLNIVCYRYQPPGLDAAALDRLNQEIVADLQELGIAAPSTTRIGGALAIRVNITNHRSRERDFDELVAATVAVGDRYVDRLSPVPFAPGAAEAENHVAAAGPGPGERLWASR